MSIASRERNEKRPNNTERYKNVGKLIWDTARFGTMTREGLKYKLQLDKESKSV